MNPALTLWIESQLWPRWMDLAWQGTALLALSLGTVWCLRHHAASRRHGILALGMTGFGLLIGLSLVMPTWRLRWVTPERKAVLKSVPQVPVGGSVPSKRPSREEPSVRSSDQAAVLASPEHEIRESPRSVPVALSVAWMAGMIVGGVLLTLSMCRLRWLHLRSRPAQHPSLVEALERAVSEAGLDPGTVQLRLGESGAMPMMWGWRRIVILLPAEAVDWSRTRLDLVLRHELAHAVRCDAPVSLACLLAMLPLWWNPLTWAALRMLSRLREEACDEQVIRGLDRHTRADYAGMLVQVIAGTRAPFRRAWLPALAMASAQARALRSRLEAIVAEDRDCRPFTKWGRTCAAGSIAVLIAGLSTLTACRETPAPVIGSGMEDGSRMYFLTDKQWELLTKRPDSERPITNTPPPDPFASNGLKPRAPAPEAPTGTADLRQAALRIRTHLLEAGVAFTSPPEGEVVVLKDERTMQVWTDDAGHGLITRILAREEKKPLVHVICHVFAVPFGSEWLKALTNTAQAPMGSQAGVTGMLSPEQASTLIDGIRGDKTCSIFSTPTVTVPSGQRAVIENIREFIYPTEFDPPHVPQSPPGSDATVPRSVIPTTPTAFEMRPVGFRCEVEPVSDAGGGQIELKLAPEWTVFEGFVNYGAPIYGTATDATGKIVPVELTANAIQQPVFRTSKVTTSVAIRDGHTLVLGGFGEPPGADVGRPTESGTVRPAAAASTPGAPAPATFSGTQGDSGGNLNLSKLPPVSKVDRAVFFLFQAKVLE